MREIKFRVFVKEGDSMFVNYDNNYLVSLDGVLNYDNGYEVNDIGQEENIISQYTGLKDKNGKPIYEGDILEIEWENTTTRSIVKYHVGYASSGFVFMIGGSGFSECSGIENGKVIGNIYENPELLDKLNK